MDVAVRDYWFLPVDQQVQVRMEVFAPVLGAGHVYWVQGRVEVEELEYCDCEWCQGHSYKETVVVDEMIAGADEQDAAENVIRRFSRSGDAAWVEDPVVKKLID